jgi:hypothetical protein
MSRDLSSGVVENLEDDIIYPFFAVELLFDVGDFTAVDGTVNDRILRLWTGFGTLTYQGRQAKLYFGLLQKGQLQTEGSNFILLQDGGKIFLEDTKTSLTEVFIGYMDQMSINESPDTASIQLTLENRLIDLERARVGRFTSEYQKSIYPTDKGFDFVEGMQDLKLNWGRTVD